MNKIENFSKENISEMHNTLLSFILIFLEKQKDNKVTLQFTMEELENVTNGVANHEYILNTLFEPILDEDEEVVGVELKLERLNRNDLLIGELFQNNNNMIM